MVAVKPAYGRPPQRHLSRLVPLLLFLCYFSWPYVWSSSQARRERRAAHARESAATAAAEAVAFTGATPQLHGFVNKLGVLAQDRWHPRHVNENNAKFLRWITTRKRRPAKPTLSPHVSPGCAVLAVSCGLFGGRGRRGPHARGCLSKPVWQQALVGFAAVRQAACHRPSCQLSSFASPVGPAEPCLQGDLREAPQGCLHLNSEYFHTVQRG